MKQIGNYEFLSPVFYFSCFHSRQRDNAIREAEGKPFITVQFLEYNKEHSVDHGNCALRARPLRGPIEICNNFARFGWCTKGQECRGSHDVDDILDAEMSKRRKRKRKEQPKANGGATSDSEISIKDSQETVPMDGSGTDDLSAAEPKYTTGLHRAGYDAFMTGYAFATFLLSYMKQRPSATGGIDITKMGLEQIANKVFLSGKNIPLQIRVGNFAKRSTKHSEKYKALFGET